MADIDPKNQEIINTLQLKAGAKQFIFRKTQTVFAQFKNQIKLIVNEVGPQIHTLDKNIEVSYQDMGDFEMQMKFSGDTLVFMMHTNVFNFPPEDPLFKTDYIKQDPMRGYCGMIMIYNFLSDSIKYSRMNDSGYLIARVFVNKDGHFMAQGRRQFSFLYNDFTQYDINEAVIRMIIQTAMLNTIDFDLFVPPFDSVKEMSLMQKMMEAGNAAIKTGKRLGFGSDSGE